MACIPEGWSGVMPATEKVQGICDLVKILVEIKTGTSYDVFKALLFMDQQVTSGKNYLILVYVGEERFLLVMVYVGRPENMSIEIKLTGVQEASNKMLLEPFKPNV